MVHEIIIRDKHRCLRCRRSNNLCVHEITPKSVCTDWKREDNQITLCSKCHTEIHAGGALNYVEELKELLHGSCIRNKVYSGL